MVGSLGCKSPNDSNRACGYVALTLHTGNGGMIELFSGVIIARNPFLLGSPALYAFTLNPKP